MYVSVLILAVLFIAKKSYVHVTKSCCGKVFPMSSCLTKSK